MKQLTLERKELKHNFLTKSLGNKDFEIHPIPADCSLRTYYRIKINNVFYILMNCPPEYTDLLPFITISEYLRVNNFSAPKIYHIDHQHGFLLLEDFGDISFAKYLNENLDNRESVYKLAINLLNELQNISPPENLKTYNKELLISELNLYMDWYVPYLTGEKYDANEREVFNNIWSEIAEKLPLLRNTIVLRDFHVENMLLLNRNHIQAIGLIDFQDALLGSPIYDLVSLLQDARIDVPQDIAHNAIKYYIEMNPKMNSEDIYLSYHILGAQRNSRILGVFARQAVLYRNEKYLQYLPRVKAYLNNDLSHPALNSLKSWMLQNRLLDD